MQESDFPSHAATHWWGRKSTWIVAASGGLACVMWVVPNWKLFWDNLGQFSTLWQLQTNRLVIVYLCIKMLSPLFVMGIVALLLWIYAQVKAEADGVTAQSPGYDAKPQVIAPPVQSSRRLPPVQPVALPAVVPLTSPVSPSSSTVSTDVQMRRGYDPVTPLPPVMPSAEAIQEVLQRQPPHSVSRSLPASSAHLELRHGVTDRPEGEPASSSLLVPTGLSGAADPLIEIRLLKDVTMTICVPGGGGKVVVPLSLNAKRVQLLAYIAWRRGDLIDRDKILEHVFGWGLSDEEATEEKLAERFESHKKLLRKKIREVVIEQINRPAGKALIDPDIDPFTSDAGFWGLSDICRVEDLEELERAYKPIALARKDGKMIDEVPEFVKESCDRLIATYAGDFLETIIKKYPGEFKPWEGRSSWARRPYTQYRDYYLDALWYAAEYEWRQGQALANEQEPGTKEANQRRQQECFGRAAQRYQSYAMYACNSKFDSKATFGAHGEYGERVGMSERALRRCVVLLGAIGRTDLVNQVWSAYLTQMRSVSDQRWQPSQETLADVAAAKAQTNAYRFASQVAQMSSEFAERHDRVS